MRLRRYRKPFAAGAALALGFVANVAFAEWLSNGVGEGYARAGYAQALTTTAAQPRTALYPGSTGDLTLSVHNPNPFPVLLTSVQPNGTISASNAACGDGHGVSFAGYTGSHTLAANGTTEVVLEDVLTMAETSAPDCQGAFFTVPVSLNGGTSAPPAGTTWYADFDEDGFGDPTNSQVASARPTGYIAVSGDCDDANPATHPEATENPNDGIDNNCDGVIDAS